jgi:hypothetical protein
MQASGGSYVGAVVGTPGAHQQQNKAKGLLVLLQAIHSCLKRSVSLFSSPSPSPLPPRPSIFAPPPIAGFFPCAILSS